MNITRERVHHPDRSFRCERFGLEAFAGKLHRHAHVEVTWIERGQGLRWVGGSVEPFQAGDLVVVGADVPHRWMSQVPRARDACVATVLQFPSDWAARTGLPELRALARLMQRARRGLAVSGATHAAAVATLARLPGRDGAASIGPFVDLLDTLACGGTDLRPLLPARGPAVASATPAPAARRRADRVVDWIQANLARELRIDDAAALAHVTPAAFPRFFRREVGRSFVDYVNDARCGWAALRLLEGREPVAVIAHGCGFSTLSNFRVQFRRRYGAAPREYAQVAVPGAGSDRATSA